MRALLCWGIPDIAKFVALRPRFDICYAVDADSSTIEYLTGLFAFDPKVHLQVSSGSINEFCAKNGVDEIDTLVIVPNYAEFNSADLSGFLETRRIRSVRLQARTEDLKPSSFEDERKAIDEIEKLLSDGYEPAGPVHGTSAVAPDIVDVRWTRKEDRTGEAAGAGLVSCGAGERAYCFNMVYAHLTDTDAYVTRRGKVSMISSAAPLPGCDLYFYVNAYSYRGRQRGHDILLLAEPIVVLPGQYNEDVWSHFDHILTLYDTIVEREARFTKVPMFRSDGWLGLEGAITEDMSLREKTYPIQGRRKAILMINGNKRSSMEGELYSKRIEAATWFFHNSDIPFDVFGTPPFFLPNYKGTVPPGKRFPVLAQYRFNLCFENMNHPLYAKGYVEKILDCLETRTVPIYYGGPNIEMYVPKECFIDFREFDGFADLDRYLHSMTEDEYMSYVENIDTWVCRGGLRPYTWRTMFDYLIYYYASTEGLDVSSLAKEGEHWSKPLPPQESIAPFPVFWTLSHLAAKRSMFLPNGLGLGTCTEPGDLVQKAISLAANGKHRDALQEMARVPFDLTGDKHFVAAQLMYLAGLQEPALVQLRAALGMNPNHSQAYNQLGVVLYQKKEQKEAEAAFRKAIDLDGANHLARKNLALLLLNSGRRGEAIPLAKSVEPYFPEEVRGWGL
jgi:tetratricopeptide (TPR) repeat protein